MRGRLNRVVSPVLVSTLARMTVSVRVPVRPLPASPPSSRTFSRGLSAHWSCAAVAPLPGLVCRVGLVALRLSSSLRKTPCTAAALS